MTASKLWMKWSPRNNVLGLRDSLTLRNLRLNLNPNGQRLQALTFGFKFNQSLRSVKLSRSPRTLSFGDHFNQSLEAVTLSSSLQT